MRKRKNAALSRAIESVGGLSSLAARLGVSKQVVFGWVYRGNVPPDRVLSVEAATVDNSGRATVRRHELRPDLYPPEQA